MLHGHIVSFLEVAVACLLLTNAISTAAAISAVRLLKLQVNTRRTPTAIEHKLNLLLGVSS
jgi:hypothetical protein